MRNLKLEIKKTKKLPKKEVVRHIFSDKNSEDIDDYFLLLSSFINLFNKLNKKDEVVTFCDNHNVIYLPLIYIEVMRGIVIKMYEQSDDPIAQGYISKSNLQFAMEHVKWIYNNEKTKSATIIKKAAFIFYNIASKHPFADGNKRTAIIACNSFLEYNSYSVGNLPYKESYEFIMQVAKGEKNEIDCQKFLKKHISKLRIAKKTEKEIMKLMDKNFEKNEKGYIKKNKV